MSAFFAMGGYAAFVWPSYAASALVIGLAIALTVSGHRKARALVARLEAEEKMDRQT